MRHFFPTQIFEHDGSVKLILVFTSDLRKLGFEYWPFGLHYQ